MPASFNPAQLHHYSTTELEEYAAEGHTIPADVYLTAQQREGTSAEHIKAQKRLDKITTDAQAKRQADRDAHRADLQQALENVELARDKAAVKLRRRALAQQEYARAYAHQQRAYDAVRAIVDTHFTDAEDASKNDPDYYISPFTKSPVVNGEDYPPHNDYEISKRPAYRYNEE